MAIYTKKRSDSILKTENSLHSFDGEGLRILTDEQYYQIKSQVEKLQESLDSYIKQKSLKGFRIVLDAGEKYFW